MKINLFCFPFAGGSKYSYHEYVKFAPSYVNIIPINYPGRGSRFHETLLTDLESIIDDSYRQIKSELQEPYAMYGHSMGTMVAYLLTKRIIQDGLPKPCHLFLSGRSGPSVVDRDEPTHLLAKDKFISRLKEIGGSPDEVLHDNELMNFFEPVLRADFKALEDYKYIATDPFDIPLTILIGRDEEIELEEAEAWQNETTLPIDIRQLQGKHFFIFEHPQKIMEIVGQKLISSL